MFSKLALPLGPHTWVAVRERVHGPYLLKMSAVAMWNIPMPTRVLTLPTGFCGSCLLSRETILRVYEGSHRFQSFIDEKSV